jgi:DNA-binding winged helix-turn-helix (wHTH) protein
MQRQLFDPPVGLQPKYHDAAPTIRREPAPPPANTTLEFDRFCVLLRRRQLFADGAPVELGTRAFDLLMVLIEADGRLVTKRELLARVWPTTVVAEANLKVQVAALRKALGPADAIIRTDFGLGYRFTAEIRCVAR